MCVYVYGVCVHMCVCVYVRRVYACVNVYMCVVCVCVGGAILWKAFSVYFVKGFIYLYCLKILPLKCDDISCVELKIKG